VPVVADIATLDFLIDILQSNRLLGPQRAVVRTLRLIIADIDGGGKAKWQRRFDPIQTSLRRDCHHTQATT
jgi:hypothetical protein